MPQLYEKLTEKKRVVFIGLGDCALFSIGQLQNRQDIKIFAITPRPAFDTGQDLGLRLNNMKMRREYAKSSKYSSFSSLDKVKIIIALVTNINFEKKLITMSDMNGEESVMEYDVVVVATGVKNGFWRPNKIETLESRNNSLEDKVDRVESSKVIAVIGGGGSGLSAALSIKEMHPSKEVHFFFSRDEVLPSYHPNIRKKMKNMLLSFGVVLHPRKRAIVPAGFTFDDMTSGNTDFEDGSSFTADLVIWTLGPTIPNTSFLPKKVLSKDNYVLVNSHLEIVGVKDAFSVGDCADTDPNRSSATNGAHEIIIHNVSSLLNNSKSKKTYTNVSIKWGSIYLSPRNWMIYSIPFFALKL